MRLFVSLALLAPALALASPKTSQQEYAEHSRSYSSQQQYVPKEKTESETWYDENTQFDENTKMLVAGFGMGGIFTLAVLAKVMRR